MVHVTVGTNKIKSMGHMYQIKRNQRHLNSGDFVTDLENVDWSPVMLCNDVNDAVKLFQTAFSEVCNHHAP